MKTYFEDRHVSDKPPVTISSTDVTWIRKVIGAREEEAYQRVTELEEQLEKIQEHLDKALADLSDATIDRMNAEKLLRGKVHAP